MAPCLGLAKRNLRAACESLCLWVMRVQELFRAFVLAMLTFLPAAFGQDGGPAGAPLQTQELALMLRGGYTSAEVLQEVATRHVIDPLDAATEKKLLAAGADARLIDALKSGNYNLAPGDAAAARQRLQAAALRVQADRAAGRDRLAGEVQQPASTVIGQHMASLLRGKLVTLANGSLRSYDDDKLATKKYFGLYYSAHWCPPCRKFTPELVDFYKQMSAAHPEFEIVFVSDDRTADDMQQYMQLVGMPWAALRYDLKSQERDLTHYAGSGIPDLVIVDGNGKVLSDSYVGGNYVGPQRAMNDLGKLLAARQ